MRSEHGIWISQTIAVCQVDASGEIVRANERFLQMIAVPALVTGMHLADVLAQAAASAAVSVESVPIESDGGALWIFCPISPAADRVNESSDDRSNVAFRRLHDTVAQSVAALAMNLFLVHQSGATSSSPKAEKILRSSLDLVEQCAKEVRGICTLLQRQSNKAGRNCA